MSFEKRILTMATVAAHSNFEGKGFRQRDVRFLAELLTNWIDVLIKPDMPKWHNTQAMRFLDDQVKRGHAKTSKATSGKVYALTRLGLLELMNELVDIRGYADIKNTFLIFYFLRAYRDRIVHLIEKEGSGFSRAVQIEIQQLMDHKNFLETQIRELDKEIARLRIRLDDTEKATQLAEKLSRQEQSVSQIIADVARLYPYELENQKPMEELFKEITPEQRLWEVTVGNCHRSDLLWRPQIETLESYKDTLEELRK